MYVCMHICTNMDNYISIHIREHIRIYTYPSTILYVYAYIANSNASDILY